MAPRVITSGTISFGLVSIPVKLYTAAVSEAVSFNLLHEQCGSRIKQQQFCPKCNEVVDRSALVRAYEFAKDQYVRFSDEDLKALEAEVSKVIDLSEFVPLQQVDPIYFDKAYYLGPDKGGEKAYRLLADAMSQSRKVALGKFAMRGKESLVLIRAAQDGLMLHTMYYADEIRNFGEIDKGQSVKTRAEELELASKLIEQLANDQFQPERYKDEYRERVLELVNEKVKGKEITAIAPVVQPRGQVIDIMEALKGSLSKRIEKGKKIAVAGGARQAAAYESRDADEPVSFEEFKSSIDETDLEVSEKELRRSYNNLNSLRAKKKLKWAAVRSKVKKLRGDLKQAASQGDLLQGKAKKLKAARIPLSDRDWERY